MLAVLGVAIAVASAPSPVTASEAVTPVFPGLNRREIAFALDDGRIARANVLEFRADDPSLELRPVLARDVVPGLETVVGMGQRLLPEGAVAGINAGFWLNNPVGDPNGFFVRDGMLLSEPETQGGGPRGTFARRGDGTYLMDRVDGTQWLSVDGDSTPYALTAFNRYYRSSLPYPDDTVSPLYVYTPEFGSTVNVRQLRIPPPNPDPAQPAPPPEAKPVHALVVNGLRPVANGESSGTVVSVHSGESVLAIPSNGSVVVAHGGAALRAAGIVPGTPVRVGTGLRPQQDPAAAWTDLEAGMAVGPLIVRNHERTDPGGWENEGFAPGSHSNARHPRSAIGFTDDGRVLLVTVDGRQPGYSAGMSMYELSHFMRVLGVRNSLSLDGGGSTQLVIDGVLRNRACCDRPLRPVANGLFVFHRYDFPATERLAGSGREATAELMARSAYPSGADEVVLAAGGNFPDALAGGPLASELDGPLLLTNADALPEATARALDVLRPERITILGGHGVVGPELETSLRSRGEVRRLAGRDRIETAVEAASAMGRRHERVILAPAGRFPDALSAAGPAGMLGIPILLTWQDALPASTLEALLEFDTEEIIVVGGPSVVSQSITEQLDGLGLTVQRLAGDSRYATAQEIAQWAEGEIEDLDRTGILVASGERFPDALAGGPFAAKRRQLLLLAPGLDIEHNPDAAETIRGRTQSTRATLLGGHAVLSSYVQWQLDQVALQGRPAAAQEPQQSQ